MSDEEIGRHRRSVGPSVGLGPKGSYTIYSLELLYTVVVHLEAVTLNHSPEFSVVFVGK